MLGLTNFVRPNILKTKTLHLSIERIWNYSWQNFTCIYTILNPAPHIPARTATEICLPSGWICWQKNFEAQNPRRNTSIPSASDSRGGNYELLIWLLVPLLLIIWLTLGLKLQIFRGLSLKKNDPPSAIKDFQYFTILIWVVRETELLLRLILK